MVLPAERPATARGADNKKPAEAGFLESESPGSVAGGLAALPATGPKRITCR